MRKRIESFGHACRGIVLLFARGVNARLMLLAALAAVAAGFPLNYSAAEWLGVSLCIGLVLAAEAINSALEMLADEVMPERREGIRNAKDLAAGGVLIASMGSLAVFVIILVSRIW
jgi:diacylglycerol kinase